MAKLVLVDGAAGYVGHHLVKDMINKGYRVRVTDLPGTDLSYAEKLGAEVVYSDLLDKTLLKRAVKGVDYVVHAAALFSLTAEMDILRRINVNGTRNLLEVLRDARVKHFIHISSSDVYGDLKYLPGDEQHPRDPLNDYALTKKESEDLVKTYSKDHGIPFTIVRPSAIYGHGSKYIAGVFFFWPIFLRFLHFKHLPFLRGGSKLTFVHVDDVSGAIDFLLGNEKAVGETYNLADPEFMYSANFASNLCRSFGIKDLLPFTIPVSHWLLDLYGKFMLLISGPMLRICNKIVKKRWVKLQSKYNLDPKFVPHFERQFYSYFIGHRYYSSHKLISLGYRFKNKSFDEGYPPTLQWYLNNKWLPPMEVLSKKIKK